MCCVIEARAIAALAARLSGAFVDAVSRVRDCRGRVVVSGIGKSGHVARKLAATLASTGTPAFFVHAAEANHGDLGMITPDDVVIMLSNSGETDELVTLAPHVRRQGAALIAMTGNEQSSLAQAADIHLDAAVDAEACPLGLAPTASTTAMLALGDALALALLDARGFSADDFARSHPGGALGRRLLTTVRDVMRSGDALPTVSLQATLAQRRDRDEQQGHGHDGRRRRERRRRRRVHRRRSASRDRARRGLPLNAGRRLDVEQSATHRARAARDRLRRADGAHAEGHATARRRCGATGSSAHCTSTTCSAHASCSRCLT